MLYNLPVMSWHSLDTCIPSRASEPDPALKLIRHSWSHVAGARLTGCTFPRELDKKGVLTLRVNGIEAGALLKAERSELLKRLQSFAGNAVVREIRWETVAAGPPAPILSAPVPPDITGLGDGISDPELRNVFTAACRRVLGRRRSLSRK
jgi:hypothetical protein